MLIDWFTVAAQIVNFLILIWLLKRFLYGPILRAMDQREARIRERLQAAERKRTEAEEEAEGYREKQREIEDRREQFLAEAQQAAERYRKQLVGKARDEADETRRTWQQEVVREQREFLQELRRRTGAEVIEVTRKALADLTGEDLGDRLAEVFVQRLKRLGQQEVEAWRRGARDRSVQVQASFELTGSVKARLTRAVHEVCGKEAEVQYLTGGEGFGVHLSAGDLRMEWGSKAYLDGLEQSLSELLAEVTEAPEATDAKKAAAENAKKAKDRAPGEAEVA